MHLRRHGTALLAGIGVLLALRPASAADPSTKECLAASEAYFKFANDYKLRAGRAQLLICAASSCPTDIRKECLRRVDEVNGAIPSLVFDVRDAAGNDLTAVRITMDGELLTEKLRGVAIAVDPGEHTFRFTVAGEAPIEKQLLIRESQKDRHESIRFERKDAAGSNNANSEPAGEPKKPSATHSSPATAQEPSETSERAPASLNQVEVRQYPAILNLISLGIQQDLLYHSSSTNVCSSGSVYECFQGDGSRVLRKDSPTVQSQVRGSGFSTGTLRILVGYDRFVIPRLALGLRLGGAITGKPKQSPGDAPFFFMHIEGRIAYYFAQDPLRAPLSPYVFAAGGAAETDTQIQVHYQDPSVNCNDCRLNAWKRAGFEFVSAGLGVLAVVGGHTGPFLETRYVQYLGKSGASIAGQVGYAVGF